MAQELGKHTQQLGLEKQCVGGPRRPRSNGERTQTGGRGCKDTNSIPSHGGAARGAAPKKMGGNFASLSLLLLPILYFFVPGSAHAKPSTQRRQSESLVTAVFSGGVPRFYLNLVSSHRQPAPPTEHVCGLVDGGIPLHSIVSGDGRVVPSELRRCG